MGKCSEHCGHRLPHFKAIATLRRNSAYSDSDGGGEEGEGGNTTRPDYALATSNVYMWTRARDGQGGMLQRLKN